MNSLNVASKPCVWSLKASHSKRQMLLQMVPQWPIEVWVERMALQVICRVLHICTSQHCVASKTTLRRKLTRLQTMQVVSLQIESRKKWKLHNWVPLAYMLTQWSLPNSDNKTTQTTFPLLPKRSRTKSIINSHKQLTKRIASQTTALRRMCTIQVFIRAVRCHWVHRHRGCIRQNRIPNLF